MDSDNNLRFKSILSKWTDFCGLWDKGGRWGWLDLYRRWGRGWHMSWKVRAGFAPSFNITLHMWLKGRGRQAEAKGSCSSAEAGMSRKKRKSAEEEWLKGANGWRDVTAQAAQVVKTVPPSVSFTGLKTLQGRQKQETGKRNKMLEAQQKPKDGCVWEEVRRNSEPLGVKPPSLAYWAN